MKKKLVSLLMVAAMSASLLAGCGGSSDSTEGGASSSSGSAAAEEGENKLTIWAWDKNFNIPAIQAAIDDYTTNVDPDCEIEIVEQSQSSDVENAITLAASSGDYSNLPDIFLFQDHYIQKYVADYPDAFVAVEGADINWDDFTEEKLSYSTIDGTHYGVPVDSGTVIMAYRVDLLEQCGYTIDDMTGISWADFIEVGEKVYNETGKYLLSMDGDGNDLVYMMLQAEGVSQFKDGQPYITENDTLVQVVDTIVEMVQKNVLYLANDWSDYTDQTIQGDMVAGIMNGNWIIPTMEQVSENSGKWEITSMPTLNGGEGYASNGGSSLYISGNCKNTELAQKFLAATFGGSTETYDGALTGGGVVTCCKSAAESSVYQEGVEYFNNTPIYQQIAEMTEKVPVVEQSDYHYTCRTQIAAAIINIINGTDTATALKDAEDQLNFEMGN
jgi:lactose/L-arabinose transport system substrate-binding protein